MTVRKEPSGRRSVQLEVEVPGTPEEVWRAIATGPGISSWLVPAQIEERDGKPAMFKLNFGPGMESSSPITAWNPPHKWASQSAGWVPASPPIASEWSVEAKAGGTCIVRMVQSLFASTDDWDFQLEGAAHAMPGFLRTLQLYLTYFRGQPSTVVKLAAPFEGSEAQVWDAVTAPLGLKNAAVGQRWTAPAGAPPLAGVVEHYTENPYDALLRLETPAPAIAALGAYNCGGSSTAALCFYFYGENAAQSAARETPRWQAWFNKQFPAMNEQAAQ